MWQKIFFLSLDKSGLCKDCIEENTLAQKEKAALFYDELADTWSKIDRKVTFFNGKTEEVARQTLSDCDRFVAMLQQIPDIPYFEEILERNSPLAPGGHYHENKNFSEYFLQKTDNGGLTLHSERLIKSVERCRRNADKVITDILIESIEVSKRKRDLSAQEDSPFYIRMNNLPLVKVVPSASCEKHPYDENQDLTFKASNITTRTSLKRLNIYFSVDVETTGLSPSRDEIIQVSAIRFEEFEPVEAFTTYVKPRKGLNPEAAQINGITERDIENAPYMEEIVDQLNAFLMVGTGDLPPIIGHNLRFDYNFLLANGVFAVAEKRRLYDTLALSRRQYVGFPKFKLDFLANNVLDIHRSDAHDALSDALVTGMLFKKICHEKLGFDGNA